MIYGAPTSAWCRSVQVPSTFQTLTSHLLWATRGRKGMKRAENDVLCALSFLVGDASWSLSSYRLLCVRPPAFLISLPTT